MAALLDVRDLSVRFGGVIALDGVSFSVEAGQVVAVIGPNGAGKTTLFNIVTRVYRPVSGSVHLDGQSVLGISPHQVIKRGLARTFQNVALFRSMTVLENVLVGNHSRTHTTFLGASVPTPGALRMESDARPAAPRSRSRRCHLALKRKWSSPVRLLPGHAFCCSMSRPAGSATRR